MTISHALFRPQSVAMDAAQSQRVLSPLESLPGELRNRIYRYAIVEENGVIAAKIIDWQARTWRSTQPALAAACKQFRSEILPILYAENTFVLAPTYRQALFEILIRRWVQSISRNYRPLIARVGASFYIMKTFDDGHKESIEANVTADVSVATTTVFRVSDGLADKCDCRLRDMSITQHKDLHGRRIEARLTLLLIGCSALFSHYTGNRNDARCKKYSRSMGTQ